MGPDLLAFAPVELPHLTRRELQFLKCLGRGLAYKQIAGEMGITIGTAKIYADRMHKKFGLHNKVEMVLFALRNGLIE